MPVGYLSFMREEEINHSAVLGKNLSFLKHLKQKHDPNHVFKAAVSYL